STVRFESIELAGPLLPAGPFEAVTRRQGDGTFGALSLRSLADGLAVNLASPKPEDDGAIRFQFDGAPWQATVGPRVQWSEVRGSGRVRARFIEISDFLLVGYFGSIKGTVYAAADQFWVVTGYAAGANLDVESMVRPAGRADDGGRADRRPAAPFGGTVNFDLLLAGRGASFEDAVRSATAAGPFKVKWAAVNGINLGYAATRPGAVSGAGGVTRFTDLSGWLVLGPGGASLQDMEARAGALATRGQVVIDRDGRLNGALRVDLGGTRVQAPLNLRVSGTVAEPVFGR
ncbi:MAG: hypothetical protein N2439_09305, partial [Anaerolineae bacterium]|nr:hypothetical protein [Anaerolineae bacterium]